jgi:hypothetical protein
MFNKTKKQPFNHIIYGGGAPPVDKSTEIDLQTITQQEIEMLMQQGIMPEQLADLALQQGQQIPPLVQQMMSQSQPSSTDMKPSISPPSVPDPLNKASQYPSQMTLPQYADYKKMMKVEKEKKDKLKFGAHKQNVYGYVFSDLINEDLLRDVKRTQGSFLIGLNLNNLVNEMRKMIMDSETQRNSKKKTIGIPIERNSEELFKRLGEYVNVDFEKILDGKMGYRGSDIPLLPEEALNDYSSFYEVIYESKKYADKGYNGKITPLGLLIMTRMLYKYRKSNAQWFRVATILELIYKYLSDNQLRAEFFKNKDEIPVLSLIELEEFYNTDHLFMTENELKTFKQELNFYKYDSNLDIKIQIKELLGKKPPPI